MLLSPSFCQPLGALLFMCIVTSVWLLNSIYLHLNYAFPTFDIHVFKAVPLIDLSAANSTLGFEVILAVSSEDPNDINAWRRDGLVKAANRTGLSIEIPHQPDVLYKDMKMLMNGPVVHKEVNGSILDGEETKRLPNEGQAQAWLAHLHLLDHIIKNNISTALILEDDADWDISLRSQILPIASAIRNMTQESPQATSPYGTNWDILWIGHCGATSHRADLITIPDPSILPTSSLRKVFTPFTYDDLPEQTRIVHRTPGPICTFGYAVTLASAKTIREYMSTTDEAYDVKLSRGCHRGLRCITTTPELIHHQRSLGSASLSLGTAQTEKELAVRPRRFTLNIRHSARCNWNRPDQDLVQCLPSEEEWKMFYTR